MAEQFWQETFADLETSSYPVLPAVGYQSSITKIIDHEIDHIDCATGSDSPYTLSTKLQAAWALLLAQYANTQDVVFGTSMNPLEGNSGLQDVLPLRIPVNGESDLAQWLQANQARVQAMQEVQSCMSLDQIQYCSPEAKEACEFRTSLLLRNSEQETYEVCCKISQLSSGYIRYLSTRDLQTDQSYCVPRETIPSPTKRLSIRILSF
jgi:non-ribosomal peptide synthetase component F